MDHAGRAAEAQHRLVEIGQRQVHGKQAALDVVNLLQFDAVIGEAPVEPPFQDVEGHGRRVGQRGLLGEVDAVPQIHGVEKCRRRGAFGRREVVGAVVHEHQLVGADGRG